MRNSFVDWEIKCQHCGKVYGDANIFDHNTKRVTRICMSCIVKLSTHDKTISNTTTMFSLPEHIEFWPIVEEENGTDD
jgi:hypothetical protein